MYKPFDLTGKVALVTGGNSGIGLGMARALAEAGADVAIWGTNATKNAAAQAGLAETGRRVLAVVGDVSDESGCGGGLRRDRQGARPGRWLLCQCGGERARGDCLVRPDEERGVAARAQGQSRRRLLHLPRRSAPHDRARWGRGAGWHRLARRHRRRGPQRALRRHQGRTYLHYRALAVEFARHGVRANAILPGWIETDMTANAIANEKFAKNVLPRIPMRRWGTGSDFGGIAVYLMSPASAYHTGDTFLIRRRVCGVLKGMRAEAAPDGTINGAPKP